MNRFLARMRVPLGLAFGASYLWLARPVSLAALAWGLLVAATGEALRSWAAGHVRKDEQVIVSGPYRYVRHPLYLGSTLLGLGACLAATNWERPRVTGMVWLLGLALILVTCWVSVRMEERGLEELFGEAYRDYERRTPRFLPDLLAHHPVPPGSGGFSLHLAVVNGEWKTVLGFLAVSTWLVVRYLK